MNRLRKLFTLVLIAGLGLGLTSCFNDLDTQPLDPDVQTADVVFDNPDAYEQVLAKLYAGLSVSGQEGPAGLPDISGIDEGFSNYLRQLWKHEELTTDEAVIAWNDGTIQDLHQLDWDANNEFITAMYNRLYYQIALANEYLRETTDEKLSGRGLEGDLRSTVETYRAEARFLRALSYWHALDMFRNVPFVTEEDQVGAFFPEQIQAADLFNFIESELLAIESELMDARTNVYGRADKGAAWTLLAKLYLNAEVYTGRERNTDCVNYSKRVIDAGYTLEPEYRNLFVADNESSPEAIFSINFDGQNTRTFGGTTFIIHASVGADMNPSDSGIDNGWGGTRTTSALVNKFPSANGGGEVIVAPATTDNEYAQLYVPGAYQGWMPDNENVQRLYARNGDNNYEGFLYFPEAGEFKFTPAPNWDADFGDNGGDGTLDPGGANLSVPAAGVYRIRVNLDDLTYTIEPIRFGIIGAATVGGWDGDQDLTYDPELGALTITTPLVADEFKFRANDAWDFDFGDNGADGILEPGGQNLSINRAGTFKVILYLNRPDFTYSIVLEGSDTRAMFFTEGQTLEIEDISQFDQGYAVTKFSNLTRDGVVGSDLTFPDTDFHMFRLGDVYLMFAEAVLRGGSGGTVQEAVGFVNRLRVRAYGNDGGNIQNSDMDLAFIIDERARELYWEAQRRTDLVRFGLLTSGDYLWPFKGGVPEGTEVSAFRRVYPIPSSDIGANPNLRQNPGY